MSKPALPARPRSRRRRGPETGGTIVEVTVVLLLMVLAGGIAAPALADALARWRLRAASQELATLVRGMRTEAVLGQRSLGVHFDRERDYAFAVYRDGNGNGVRRVDIRSGVDRRVRAERALRDGHPGVAIAILPPDPIPEIPPRRGPLRGRDDPLKLGGRTEILSCSPAGTCTSGTIYLSAGPSRMVAVRVRGWNAQVQVWEYEPRGKRWTRRGF